MYCFFVSLNGFFWLVNVIFSYMRLFVKDMYGVMVFGIIWVVRVLIFKLFIGVIMLFFGIEGWSLVFSKGYCLFL